MAPRRSTPWAGTQCSRWPSRQTSLAGSKRTFLAAALLTAALVGTPHRAVAQVQSLPVYHVDQFGATPSQVRLLSDALNIPLNQFFISNGLAMYVNGSNYLAVPSMPVTDPAALRLLLDQTVNETPGIPIQAQQIDFGALGNLTVYDPATALRRTSDVLASAGLTPSNAVPVVKHATFTAFYTNESNTVTSNSVSLDTEVEYSFTLPGGYPLEGPGAQVQMDYGAAGDVTRLLYAAPRLSPGPMVPLIPMADALARAAALMDPTHSLGQLNLTGSTVYRLPHCLPCVAGPIFVMPWVKVEGTVLETNRVTGEISVLNLMPRYIPATDDPGFVPQVTLNASTLGGTQVTASVSVSGGTPPYTYAWSGSSPDAADNSGSGVRYAPIVRATPPPLELEMIVALHAVLIHWWAPDPTPWASEPDPHPWVLETKTDLNPGPVGWTQVNNPIQTSNGVSSVLVPLSGPRQFFRLRLAQQTVQTTETLSVEVTDANGVTVPAVQTIPVLAQVQVATAAGGNAGPRIRGVVDWGTESPYDPGLGTGDRQDWVVGMLFGGAGTQRFLWTGTGSWKEDFLNAPLGINDWEVDNADITLYIGHGNPTVFTFTGGPGPSPTTCFYNEPTRSWGNYDQEWMCLLSCDVLQYDYSGRKAWQRWGPDFDGLHSLCGFSSLAYAGTGFPFSFAQQMLGWLVSPMPVVKSWINAAHARGTGTPAALGPVGPGGAWDYNDYFWGRGPVGPTIRASQIHGWWYISY